MPTQSLPHDPSLENLKKKAKQLRKAVRAGDAAAVARVRELHPRAEQALADFSLADAQLVVARGYRFASWPRLKAHLEVVGRFIWDPPGADPRPDEGQPVDRFLRLACLDYEGWNLSHRDRARQMLADHPELARADIYAAATVGDVTAARELIARDPGLATRPGGPLRWEPLLHACYSRLDSTAPGHSTLEVARLLLAHGADPNAGFLWRGNVPPFTALTGAFGEGENGTNHPRHQYEEALARLLLDAGADPNDGQTLYNRHFNPSDDHLKLLFAYGLGQDKGGPWYRRLGDRLGPPAGMLVEELWAAAKKNYFARVKLLVEHGADVNTPGFRDGRTPYESALVGGNREIAAYLLAHGAKPIELDPVKAFASACVAADEPAVRSLLARDPALVDKLGRDGRIQLVHKAVESHRPEAIRLMASLGFELSGLTRNTPMHDAAWAGDLELVKLLVELGADPNVREPTYGATPLGWAEHNHQQEVVDYLTPLTHP